MPAIRLPAEALAADPAHRGRWRWWLASACSLVVALGIGLQFTGHGTLTGPAPAPVLASAEDNSALYDENPEGFGWYFVFRAADAFFKKEGRHPSPTDKEQLLALAGEEVKKSGINPEEFQVASRFAEEM